MTEEEKKQLKDLHDFFMKSTGPGKPARAELIDDALGAIAAGKLGGRLILWLGTFLAAVGVIAGSLKGWRF